jgi:type I restriction enzyme S subunit
MSNWREVPLGEVCELKRGYDLPKRSRKDGPYPIVSSSGISGTHSDMKVPGPGVVTGRYGTLGQVFFVDEDFWPLNTALYVRDFKSNNPRFVALLLESMDLAQHDGAAAVPGLNRNQLHTVMVRVPDSSSQDRIALIASSLDRLIANGRRRVELLEEMARLICREWFVHFRYPGHEDVVLVDSELGLIPDGWDVQPLFATADVGFGYSFKSNRFAESGPFPVVRIRDVPRGETMTFTDEACDDKYRIVDGDVLIGMDGEFYIDQWAAGGAWLNQRVARLRPKGELSGLHLMLAISSQIREWNVAITGTTVAHLGKKHLEQVQVLVPPASLLEQASEIFGDISGERRDLLKSMRLLKKMRDLLLPGLVSGRIDVSDLDLDLPEDGAA